MINVTVYTHRLYSTPVESVSLGVKIDDGAWNNYSITANVFDSSEGDLENYFYVIPAQADGTNITVQAIVEAAGTHVGEEMVIRVRDEIATTIPPPTSTTTTTTDDINALIMQLLPYIVIAVVAVIGALCVKQRR